MITIVRLTPSRPHIITFLVWFDFGVVLAFTISLSNFQVPSTVLLAVATVLQVVSAELTDLPAGSLDTLASIASCPPASAK